MRVNRQTLLKIASDTVEKRAKETRSLLAVYLHGSMSLEDDPFLGDSTDIDLVFIHEYAVDLKREVIPITEDVTFDIVHRSRSDYRTPRELRSHPWLGPSIYSFKILHDPRHFLDFAQASLRDQFFRPGNVLGRAQTFAGLARDGWMGLLQSGGDSPEDAAAYIDAAGRAANAVASLEGDPMPERRLLTQYFTRTEAMGQPGLYTKMLELLGAGEIDAEDLVGWLAALDKAYDLAAQPGDPERDPARKRYYLSALQAQLESERPADALWPLLKAWARAAGPLPEESPAHETWRAAMQKIGLLGEGFQERMTLLDEHLDLVEETLEGWGIARGVDAYG